MSSADASVGGVRRRGTATGADTHLEQMRGELLRGGPREPRATAPAPAAFDENSIEALQQAQLDTMRRTTEVTRNALRTAADTEQIGADTLRQLHEQTEQMHRINGRLEDVNQDLHKSKRLMNTIESWFGWMKNGLTSKTAEPIIKPRETTTTTATPAPAPVEDFSASAGPSQWMGRRATVSTAAPSTVQEHYDAQDRDLEDLGAAVKRIKGNASMMNEELVRQGDILDQTDVRVSRVGTDMRSVTRRVIKQT